MDETDKKEKVTLSNKRNNKPLMEKRRRQRINDCLVQLKSLVLQAMNKDTAQYSKLEKADILEMTVKHLKFVQRHQITGATETDPNVISKYRAGFNECAAEIARYLDTLSAGNPDLKSHVMSYLGNSMMQFPVIPVYQDVVSPYHLQIASLITSQQAFLQQHSQAKLPLSNFDYVTHQHPQQQSQNRTNRLIQPPASMNNEPGSHLAPLSESPVRHVPSPCDSESGLSDSSSSFSRDENGNYFYSNINQNSTGDIESRFVVPSELRKDSDFLKSGQRTVTYKHSYASPDEVTEPKRRRIQETVIKIEPRTEVPQPEPMWRPW